MKLYIYYRLISLLFVIITIDNHSLSFNEISDNLLFIKTKDGNAIVYLDMSIDYIVLKTSYLYNPPKDENQLNYDKTIDYHNSTIKAHLSEEKLILYHNPSLLEFNFLAYVIKNNREVDSMIGLSFHYDNSSHSVFIPKLKEIGVIDRMEFSFQKIYQNTKITFGELSLNDISKYKYKGICKVIQSHQFWGCDLKAVRFMNQSYLILNYQNKFYSYFNIKDSEILVPLEFYTYLQEKIFKNYLDKGYCIIEKNGYNENEENIMCSCDKIQDLPDISFVFGNIGLRFQQHDLFLRYSRGCLLIFQPNKYNSEQWVFGSIIINQYMITFSYEDKEIKFYSNIHIEVINNNKGIIIVLLCNTILMIITGIFLVIINKAFTFQLPKNE